MQPESKQHYPGSLIEDCAAIIELGEQMKKPAVRKETPCQCDAYSFPHRRYSGKCGEASVFTKSPWTPREPRPLGALIANPFESEADEHRYFDDIERTKAAQSA